MKSPIKDHAVLLVCALISAGLAWSFWHFLGEYGLDVFVTIALLGLSFDNYRLRRRLRRGQ